MVDKPGRSAGPADDVDCGSMDPRDRLPPFVNGVDCAACGDPVSLERIRVLASRDDLAFVEVACEGCRSESLGIIVAGADDEAGRRPTYGEFVATDHERFGGALPIGSDDVLAVRDVLARRGLAGLVDAADGPPGGPPP